MVKVCINENNTPSKNSIKKSWQKVKIKGNVVSDDGCGLEGLIGLEVLEKYDKSLVAKSRKKRKAIKERKTSDQDSGIDGDLDNTEVPKLKKKKKSQKAAKESKESSENSIPGRFVLLNPPTEEENPNVEEKLTVDDLEGWNGLAVPEPVLQALAENGFKSPTEIQSLTLPAAIIGKKDILGAAETGSGKTLAFGIPILAGILELKRRNISSGIRKTKSIQQKEKREDRENFTPPPEELEDYPDVVSDSDEEDADEGKDKPLYALILAPTRELAVQVKDHITSAARYTGIKVAAIFGGLATVKQERILKGCPEIVVATPGRLWELMNQGNPHLCKVDDISFLVIDETDRMIEKGHFEELRLLLNRLNNDENKKHKRQNFVFSATLSMVHDLPDYLQRKNIGRKTKLVKQTPGMKIQSLIEELGISQPKIVDITRSNQTAQNLTECRIICPLENKDYYLYYFILRHPGRTIVFCNSIDCVKRLSQLFTLLNAQPLPLHANMIQKQRLKNLERFTDNPNGLLIATDVAARGLDIPNVQHVIHYQVPRTSENYVHRSGRTARANKNGITILIMEPGEIKNYLKVCKTLDRSEDLPIFPVSERHLNAVKERIQLAREVDKLELRLRRSQSEIGWLKRNAEEMDILIGHSDDEESTDDDAETFEKAKDKNHLASKRRTLSSLLSKPLFPKGYSYKYPTSTGKLEIPQMEIEKTEESAIKVMKEAIEQDKIAKKERNKKRKINTDK